MVIAAAGAKAAATSISIAREILTMVGRYALRTAPDKSNLCDASASIFVHEIDELCELLALGRGVAVADCLFDTMRGVVFQEPDQQTPLLLAAQEKGAEKGSFAAVGI